MHRSIRMHMDVRTQTTGRLRFQHTIQRRCRTLCQIQTRLHTAATGHDNLQAVLMQDLNW